MGGIKTRADISDVCRNFFFNIFSFFGGGFGTSREQRAVNLEEKEGYI